MSAAETKQTGTLDAGLYAAQYEKYLRDMMRSVWEADITLSD
jgi:hypothetical protein